MFFCVFESILIVIEMTEKLHPCCDPSSPSPIWGGVSTGRIITVDDVEIYVIQARENKEHHASSDHHSSGSGDTKRVILFLTEGHSIYFINAQLLADSFATHLNCDVIMPDEFQGDRRVPTGQLPHFPEGKAQIPPPEGKVSAAETSNVVPPPYHKAQTDEEFEIWKKTSGPHVTDPILERVVKYIHRTYGEDVMIGGVGYCFGGRYVIRLMGSGVIDVGVVNHPSFFTLEEVEKLGLGKRLAIYAAETDDILTPEKRRATEDVLTKGGATWMSTVFSGTEHGFSVRGDLKVKEVRLAKEKAFRGAVEWFNNWL
jgi:dienelactone hydrolase